MGSEGDGERMQLGIDREDHAKRSPGLARGLAVIGLSLALVGVLVIVGLEKVGWFWPTFSLAVLALLAREWVP